MGSIGRVTSALVSGNNENTLALANVNFDFSLMRFDAPAEFQPFGAVLSKQRREEAEEGGIHRLARRLGALFESFVPQTPNLIKAYGRRTSEVAASPRVNPQGSEKDGPFRAYVGADGASIWAAATSLLSSSRSHPPLAIHLLACILARAWKAEDAVAIWVELVSDRRREIESSLDSDPQSISACMAARQDIPRSQLALWDASARSWLRSADSANGLNRTRLQLLMNNMHMSFTHHKTTYDSVISVWRNAMIGMEKALIGTPQEVSDGSLLMALSTWHIYPNLIILGLGYDSPEKVSFDDPLVPSSGVITIGLDFGPKSRPAGMHWSLVLNHLRYYGGGVQVKSSDQGQRVTMHQFFVLIFGDLLSCWDIPRVESAEVSCAEWILQLSSYVDTFRDESICFGMRWFETIALSARTYLSIRRKNADLSFDLVSWGRRRCSRFMKSTFTSPFFGLAFPRLVDSLTCSSPLEAGIKYLRSLAAELGLSSNNSLIRYRDEHKDHTELMTAVPYVCPALARGDLLPEAPQLKPTHCRWFEPATPAPSSRVLGLDVPRTRPGLANAPRTPIHETREWVIHSRTESVSSRLGEDIRCLDSGHSIPTCSNDSSLVWNRPPLLFQNIPELCHSEPLTGIPPVCTCFRPCSKDSADGRPTQFRVVHGKMSHLCLLAIDRPPDDSASENISAIVDKTKTMLVENVDTKAPVTLKPKILIAYLRYVSGHSRHRLDALLGQEALFRQYDMQQLLNLASVTPMHGTHADSLRSMLHAAKIYEHLEEATIPLHVLDLVLMDAPWVKLARSDHFRTLPRVSYDRGWRREVQFACIAMFESGNHQLDVGTFGPVIAMASADSLFVASELVTDPADDKKPLIHRVIGNVGRAGMSLLVLPQQPPEIRPLGYDWRAVPHEAYDGQRPNLFQNTNLVLSFTDWTRPFHTAQRGTIDESLFFVECVVSVHDKGEWVADINPMGHRSSHSQIGSSCDCGHPPAPTACDQSLVSIDSWEELLDPPSGIGIFRARGNRFARLAAAVIRRQQDDEYQFTWIIPDTQDVLCSLCLVKSFPTTNGRVRGLIID